MSPILEKIQDMPDGDIVKLFNNACDLVSDPKRAKQASDVLEEIDRVWGERLALAKKGKYKGSAPETGLLSTLKYHVGQDATPAPKRRMILDQILMRNIPFVPPPSYMEQWGDPMTDKRLKKLKTVLQQLIYQKGESARGRDYEKAVSEWQSDLEYVEENYSF